MAWWEHVTSKGGKKTAGLWRVDRERLVGKLIVEGSYGEIRGRSVVVGPG